MSEVNQVAATTVATVLSEQEIRIMERKKRFMAGVSISVAGDQMSVAGAVAAANEIIEMAAELGLDREWTTVHATKLHPVLRDWHGALKADLESKGHSNPKQVWKRIREKAVLAYAAIDKAALAAEMARIAAEGGVVPTAPTVTESESKREKVRRLCEEDIQKMYSRIMKAEDCDLCVQNLIPVLRDMAEDLGFELVEPESK